MNALRLAQAKALARQRSRNAEEPRHRPVPADAAVTPTPERRRHGPVERLERAIADEEGRPARPYRTVDTLALMERRGSITAAMRQAGEDFRTQFRRAALDPLRALDPARPPVALGRRLADEPSWPIEAARRAVWRALQAVGGLASPAGSCLWHVVGWERSLKEWAREQGWNGRRVSEEAASGIMIATLGILASHSGSPTHNKLSNYC
jgi:hypothetical protein